MIFFSQKSFTVNVCVHEYQGVSILSSPHCINRSAVRQHLQLPLVVFFFTQHHRKFSATLICWISHDSCASSTNKQQQTHTNAHTHTRTEHTTEAAVFY